jgi:nicotinamidase-related amidase
MKVNTLPGRGLSEGLTPENALLVLIDHQLGLMSIIRDMSPREVENNVLGLAKAAKTLQVPVVLTSNVAWGINGRMLPQLRRIFPDQAIVSRPGIVNAYSWPGFRDAIAESGRPNIIIAGVTASTGLLFPALDLSREGYDVHAVIDACGAESTIARDMAVATMLRAGVKARTWFSVTAELLGDWRCDLENGSPLAFGAIHDHLISWGHLLDKAIDREIADIES